MENQQARRKVLRKLAALPLVSVIRPHHLWTNPPACKVELSHKFKLSLNLYSFNKSLRAKDIDLFEVLDFCAKYNFDAVDPTGYYFPGYPDVPPNAYLHAFKRKAFLLGLDISGTGVRNDFANPDVAKRKADIQHIKDWVEAAATLGIPHVRIFTGRSKHEGYSREQVFEWIAQDIKICCDYAKELGIMISLQNHNEFLKTADEVDQLFEMVDSPWLGLNLDIGSYRAKDPYLEIQQNIKHAITWQIKENVWINGVATPTDFVKLFKIIKQAGYRGYLPLETLGPGDPLEKIPRLLEEVKAALELI